jgi:outer membrane lipoprotein
MLKNLQGKTRLEIATVPLDSGAPVLGAASRGRIYADVNRVPRPGGFSQSVW